MLDSFHHRIAILPESGQFTRQANSLSDKLNIPVLTADETVEINKYPVVLCIGEAGLGIRQTGNNTQKPVHVDFLRGSLAYRNRHKANSRELIVKAVGLKPGQELNVLDATAGLGRDAFILAAFGCRVHMLERSPVVFLLLQDGIRRSAVDPETASIIARMRVSRVEAMSYFKQIEGQPELVPDVICLDPMFPERLKSAKVKKEMQVLQSLLADIPGDQDILKASIGIAKKRVVVKRPRLAGYLAERSPSFSIKGKSSRFDVYQTFNKN